MLQRHGILTAALGALKTYTTVLVPEACVAHGRGRPGTRPCVGEVGELALCAQGLRGTGGLARAERAMRARAQQCSASGLMHAMLGFEFAGG
jgi:hypothetical protein